MPEPESPVDLCVCPPSSTPPAAPALQSGGFTTDILTTLDPQALLGGKGARPGRQHVHVRAGGAGPVYLPAAASALCWLHADTWPYRCIAASTGGGGGGMSAEDIKAAMRAAEDEGDAAAAVAVEREAAAEMDEFTKVGAWG